MVQSVNALLDAEPEEKLLERVLSGSIPQHIAIIMDGNGRWATRQGLPRAAGHQAGSESVRRVLLACQSLGVKMLTLYAFSMENWHRPKDEVDALMYLIEHVIRTEIPSLHDSGVRVRMLGRIKDLPRSLQDELQRDMEYTGGNTSIQLNLAINYGGRAEIVDAARALAEKARDGKLNPEEIDEAAFANELYSASYPDPDLLIRTAGEMRVSNFLLWQIAYSELWVTDTLWPDIGKRHILEAISAYQRRVRKFGGLVKK